MSQLYTIAPHPIDVVFKPNEVTYDTVLATLGFVFMVSIFSALGTTVAFKYLERKRGAK